MLSSKDSKIISFEEAKKLKKFTMDIKSLSLEGLIQETKKIENDIEKRITKQLLKKAKTLLKELERRSITFKKNKSPEN